MNERKYVDLSDRVKISMAKKILGEITPENSNKKAINIDDFRGVMKKLSGWEEKLRKITKIDMRVNFCFTF